MTHEQFVAFETAKLAKQAGFDGEVRAHYFEQNGEKAFYHDQIPTGKWNSELYDGCFSASTQSVLQRWLREVKVISVEAYHTIVWVEHDSSLAIKWFYNVCYLNSNKSDVLSSDEFDTYEAALEAGLQKCLTLLIENLYPNLKGGEK